MNERNSVLPVLCRTISAMQTTYPAGFFTISDITYEYLKRTKNVKALATQEAFLAECRRVHTTIAQTYTKGNMHGLVMSSEKILPVIEKEGKIKQGNKSFGFRIGSPLTQISLQAVTEEMKKDGIVEVTEPQSSGFVHPDDIVDLEVAAIKTALEHLSCTQLGKVMGIVSNMVAQQLQSMETKLLIESLSTGRMN